MIEIVNSDSMAGTLHASHVVKKKDLICIVDLMLDVGFLDKDYDSEYRRHLYREMFAYSNPELDPDSTDPDCDMGTYFDASISSIREMVKRAATGEAIRIWADSNAVGYCNMALISSILLKIDGLDEVYIMNQPQFDFKNKNISRCPSWSHFDQLHISEYLYMMRPMTKKELEFYSEEWERLKEENTGLRTLICNRAESVPDDFYDPKILKYVSREPIYENKAIGSFMGDTMYGLSSLIPEWRVQKMIDQGIINIDEPPKAGKSIMSRKIIRQGD